MKYFICALVFIASPLLAGDFSLEVTTPDYRVVASGCEDVSGLTWVEPGSNHFGKIKASECVSYSVIVGDFVSPVTGTHSVQADMFGSIQLMYFECANVGFHRIEEGHLMGRVFCFDDPFAANRK